MAEHRITGNTDAQADVVLAGYLRDLSARLHGPRRRREAILTELRDGLDQAVDDHVAAGSPPERAASAAIAQFGTPQAVADAFRGELATAYARRAIACFIAAGPLVGIWWLLLLHPSPWRTGLIALVAAIPVIPLIVIAIAVAGATLATTGRLMRWLPEIDPRRALTATTGIAALCLVGDLFMITIYLLSGMSARPLAAIAIAASLTRITGSITTMRHAARMRRPRRAWSAPPASPGRRTDRDAGPR